jgi:predicted alpha/beta superfamily hydrolase
VLVSLSLSYDGRERRVRVYVPPGLQQKPPLLVLFDGQNVFDDEGSYAGGWHAHAAVARLPSTVVRPLLVGVDHGGAGRIRELWSELDPFLAFLKDAVLPLVRSRWEVDPHHTTLGGSSLGGLAALMAHHRDPETWHSALVMSPSLWVDRGAPLRELSRHPVPKRSRIYLDVGERERGMAELAARLAATLRSRGYGEDALLWRPDKRGTHREVHWRRRLPKALRFLFRLKGR